MTASWRSVIVLVVVTAAVTGTLIFAITSLYNGQEQTKREAKAEVVVAKKKQDRKTAAVKKRTDKVAERVRVIRRVQVRTQRILITKGILARGPRGLQGGVGPVGKQGPGPSPAQIRAAVASYCASASCGSGATAAQVAAAVNAYCSAAQCRGPAGRDGSPLSPAQVTQAVGVYCSQRDDCRGPAGSPGPQGPGPTDEQVQAAVNAYCETHNNCAPTILAAP